MEKSLLTEVKAILKSLVISCPDKITIDKLNRDYRDVEGQNIPFRRLGYESLEQFFRSIPDTLMVFGNGPTAMVCFVANKKSDHIHDMIMRQRKPKTRARSKSRGRPNNSAPKDNKFKPKTYQPAKMSAHQLSPYQSVNRNYMTKTPQVKNLPQIVHRNNNMRPALANQMLYALPQPNGILLNTQPYLTYSPNPSLNFVQNGLVNINQISSLLQQKCNITSYPPPIPRHQSRTVQFSSATKSTKPVEVTKKEYSDNVTKEIEKKSAERSLTETTGLCDEIKTQKVTKQEPIKLSDDVESLLNMPKLSKVSNPIKEYSTNFCSVEQQKEVPVQETKSTNENKSDLRNGFFDDSTDKAEDPDEAVPSFAAKNNVFRLDFPEHTVNYGIKISPYKIPDHVTVGSTLKIFITEIHNPFKFWFNIHKDNDELDWMMFQIERYYNTLDPEDLRIPVMCLTPGQVCAALYNGLWHRAEIVAPPVNTHVKVSFMDYGTVTEVEIGNIKFLATVFAELPAQALRGCLSHIKPRALHWNHEATIYFLSLVSEMMLYAQISEIDRENHTFYMILCETNGDKDVQVNKSLVENRYALYNEDWRPEKINHNNGKRVRHPREDFPTFSMIESAEYPSFSELVGLQQRGIDYEAIYDSIIYNQSTILNKHESASERLRNLPYFLTTSNPFRSDILLELYA